MTEGGWPTDGEAARLDRTPAFDGLRGVACVVVLFGHLWTIVPEGWLADRTGPLYGLFESGSLGVTLFLVLGGFLVTRRLVDHERRTGSFDVLRFWGRRLLRLGPQLSLLLATLFVVSRLDRWDPWPLAMTDRTLGSIATFRFNLHVANGDPAAYRPDLGHMWYLSMEQQVYFVWVAVLAWFGRFRATVMTLLAGGIAYCYWWRGDVRDRLGGTGWWQASLHTLSRADALLVGCLAALAYPYCVRFAGVARHVAAAALASLVVLLLFSADLDDLAYLEGQGIAFVFVAALLVLSIAIADDHGGVTERILAARPLRFVGSVSFPVYLWHLPVFWAASRWAADVHWAPRALVTVVVLSSIVTVTTVLVERPVDRWLHRSPDAIAGTPDRSFATAAVAAAPPGPSA